MKSTINVLVADDSPFLRRNIPRLLETDPGIKVIGTAENGQQALEMAKKLHPDVITLDVIMPVMDGITALKHIMREVPTPVLMVSSITYEGAQQTIEALSLGAIDFLVKPSGSVSLDISKIKNELINKVKTVYSSKINIAAGLTDKIKKIKEEIQKNFLNSTGDLLKSNKEFYPQVYPRTCGKQINIIALAASTGGPAAIETVLSGLPADLPVGIVIVQHIAEGFVEVLAEKFNSISQFNIKICNNFEAVTPGKGIIAPSGSHLTIKLVNGSIYAVPEKEPANTLHKPSADVLFSSIANKNCGPNTCAVIMTGMGDDGAKGIKEIMQSGGVTIAQDEASSIIFGMPKAAIENQGINIIAPLENISKEIVKVVYSSRSGDFK
ncbi:Protein-glutamate methylesterase/protein-glutamine glutaminase [Candidatus Magnetomoraceae bacterium gMMP-13]